jgi:hypothetical protein
MIGVISTAEEVPVVREFFELFKTPWEFHRPGNRYDVVLATTNAIPEVNTALLILYGSHPKSTDPENGITGHSHGENAHLNHQGNRIPVYGNLMTFENVGPGVPCLMADSRTAGLRVALPDTTLLRLGYDLFSEIRALLSAGQPVENAGIPALDIHVSMLRDWILEAGIPIVEIPPAPAGHDFIVCLTHDIDFVGIRNHKFDHSMWGFLYRSLVGAIYNFFRGRLSLIQLLKIWRAVASLPFVFLGWAKDFWEPFEWYLKVEKNLPATYFLIPFKKCPGDRVPGKHSPRRATAYDITDIPDSTMILRKEGCELAVHGIDSWHSAEKGSTELARIAAVSGESQIGIRMHWLLQDQNTFKALDNAGYAYDSTAGYNETIGYRNGTTQPFRPADARTLLELPLHIQDGALFYPQRLDLSETEARNRCSVMVAHAIKSGGVLTVLWHDRSHGPERFWGGFYIRFVQELKATHPWFGTAGQVVEWFRKRREIRFEIIEAQNGIMDTQVRYTGEEILPPVNIRVHKPITRAVDGDWTGQTPSKFMDTPWNGEPSLDWSVLLRGIAPSPTESRNATSRVDESGLLSPKGP